MKEAIKFSGRGTVWSFTTVYDAPEGFEKYAPYTVALIKLEEGPLVTAQLTDVNNNKVYLGMPVEMVTRVLTDNGERGLITYGYKFRPPIEENGKTIEETIREIMGEGDQS